MSGQFVAVSAKGVGRDNLRTGVDVCVVNLGYQTMLGQVQGVKTLVETGTAGVEHGAHRAIAQEGLVGFL